MPSQRGRGINDLPSSALLDLCDVELQQAVEPLNKLLSVIAVGSVSSFAVQSIVAPLVSNVPGFTHLVYLVLQK
jgi:hypothetical protein